MALRNNSRLAWSVAIAAMALWATSVPITWGYARMTDVPQTETPLDASAGDADTPCPAPSVAPVAVASIVPAAAADGSQTFHVCGSDTGAAQAIEQLLGGRGFMASVFTTSDGCADITVRPTTAASNGSSTSKLSVTLGSGQTLQIQIASQGGVTHVSITSG